MTVAAVDRQGPGLYPPANLKTALDGAFSIVETEGDALPEALRTEDMKIKNSLKALKARHRENRLVRRKGRVYIINKQNPRFKARQG